MGKSKDCYQTVKKFNLPDEHCPNCHDEEDYTMPCTIGEVEYNICCKVARNLWKAGIIPKSVAQTWTYVMRGDK